MLFKSLFEVCIAMIHLAIWKNYRAIGLAVGSKSDSVFALLDIPRVQTQKQNTTQQQIFFFPFFRFCAIHFLLNLFYFSFSFQISQSKLNIALE